MQQVSYCAEQVRRFDNDRFLCSLFAPSEQREALAAVYALNLEIARIPEIVGEPGLRQIRLQWWRDAIEQCFAGNPPRHQVALAVAEAIPRFGLRREHFDRMLEARALDLEAAPPETLAALIDYAEATSSTLAALSLEVLGGDGAAERAAARDVGIAWALTGLMRAVPFHARARRLYLPTALNRKAGLDVLALFERGAATGLTQVVEAVAQSARTHLHAARSRYHEVGERALPALLPATLADGYLDRLAKSGFNPFAASVQSPSPTRFFKLVFRRFRRRY